MMLILGKIFVAFPSFMAKFVMALPDLIQLFKTLQKRIDEEKLNHKVTDDVKAIHQAFEDKDPEKLNALFNS